MRKLLVLPIALVLLSCMAFAQLPAPISADSSTSTDVFVMPGTDVTRPDANLRLNFNVGVGHTEKFLKKDPFGGELTVAYIRMKTAATTVSSIPITAPIRRLWV